ncbi:MAG: hypothetical protein C7B45_00140 [Sulfobacillus acidophilus]|uniref:Uncharacterized protein n=1 Tax=Sulfobacillus acidophilus TaxID=53633 RepID=A0A2T2WPA7_9FIRM|nr:MAG: hypothetical protein C7B45_00140 [Sulfobacillus acidophilus]
MNGLKEFLGNTAPWSRRSIRWFWTAATLTLVMVVLAYVLLWLGVQGKLAAWMALGGQGGAVVLTFGGFWGAYRARRDDIQKQEQKTR